MEELISDSDAIGKVTWRRCAGTAVKLVSSWTWCHLSGYILMSAKFPAAGSDSNSMWAMSSRQFGCSDALIVFAVASRVAQVGGAAWDSPPPTWNKSTCSYRHSECTQGRRRTARSLIKQPSTLAPTATFGHQDRKIEVHLIDFIGDLYDEYLEVDFLRRLRDVERFDSPQRLREQLQRDIAAAKSLPRRDRPPAGFERRHPYCEPAHTGGAGALGHFRSSSRHSPASSLCQVATETFASVSGTSKTGPQHCG